MGGGFQVIKKDCKYYKYCEYKISLASLLVVVSEDAASVTLYPMPDFVFAVVAVILLLEQPSNATVTMSCCSRLG